MSILHNSETSRENGRSKSFLLGLYIGLSLLLFVSQLDGDHKSKLHVTTNIYALQALAGAILGFWRVRKRDANPGKIPAIASVFICFGLAVWVIGQVLWTWAAWPQNQISVPYGEGDSVSYILADIFYILADISWVAALLMIFKSLGRRGIIESSPFLAIVTTSLGLLVAGFLWINHDLTASLTAHHFYTLVRDLIYILVNFLSMILAIALLIGDNKEIPFPVHQCIRYLCAATAINAAALLAFIVTTKPDFANSRLEYFNGNWVDWLFLTAMYCWGVSALKCPIRQDELQYTFGSKRSGLREEEIYRSADIAKSCSEAARETEERVAYADHIRWILDNVPGCWKVIKLGELVVGSTFLFPVPRLLMKNFVEGKMTEREMFEEVKKYALTWECLYLADASILPKHRRRRLASNCFKRTIENIAKEYRTPQLEVYCCPNTLERKKLTEKLQRHFENQGISVISKD